MNQNTKENVKSAQRLNTDVAPVSGTMAVLTLVIGKTTQLMVSVDLFTPTEMSMKANGLKTKLKDLEHIVMKMDHNIKVAGNKTNTMAKVKKLGQMAQISKGFTWMGKKKEMVTLNGPMDLVIKDIL